MGLAPRTTLLPQPQPIEEWLTANVPDENLIYKNGVRNQTNFALEIARMLMHCARGDSRWCFNMANQMPKVISTHYSKSVTLPVIYMEWEGIKFYWRNNFHDVKMSIDSPFSSQHRFQRCLQRRKAFF